jgi:toxin ParE1/3/4
VKRRLAITAEAQRDLLSIRDHIAGYNPSRAESYLDELIARCELIADFPFAAPANLRNHKDWRAVPYGFYIIFYTVSERRVRIRAIKHSATLK